MQKIFINDITLILNKETPRADKTAFDIKGIKENSIYKFLKKAGKADWGKEIWIYGLPDDKILKYFKHRLIEIVAGGGLVQNENDEILFIFRKGKWDLPKGKAENNETIEETALREVEEECGISGLTIVSPLPCTYHIYETTTGEFILKKSCWFHMRVAHANNFILQEEEGITDARWVSMPVNEKFLELAYLSVRNLVSYFQNH